MIFYLIYFIPFFIFLEINTIITFQFGQDFNIHQYYIFIFSSLFFFNYYYNQRDGFKLDLDIILKFSLLLLKTPSYFFNFFLNINKKIYLYLIHFKYKYIISTINILNKKYFLNFFLVWRPLFKKTSYFGYYRSNRSKWIK